jgi:hypothetical protein
MKMRIRSEENEMKSIDSNMGLECISKKYTLNEPPSIQPQKLPEILPLANPLQPNKYPEENPYLDPNKDPIIQPLPYIVPKPNEF